jgi:hypothetical protein
MSASNQRSNEDEVLDNVYQDFFVANKNHIGQDIEQVIEDGPKRVKMVTIESRTGSVEVRRSEEPKEVIQDYFPEVPREENEEGGQSLGRPNKSRYWGFIVSALAILLIILNTASLILTIYFFATISTYPLIWSVYIFQNVVSIILAIMNIFACTSIPSRSYSYTLHYSFMVGAALIIIAQGIVFFAGPRNCTNGQTYCPAVQLYFFSLGNTIFVMVYMGIMLCVTLGKIIVMRGEDAYIEYTQLSTQDDIQ